MLSEVVERRAGDDFTERLAQIASTKGVRPPDRAWKANDPRLTLYIIDLALRSKARVAGRSG